MASTNLKAGAQKDPDVRIPQRPVPSRNSAYAGAFGRPARASQWQSVLASSGVTIAVFAIALASMTSVCERAAARANDPGATSPTTRVMYLAVPRPPASPPQTRPRQPAQKSQRVAPKQPAAAIPLTRPPVATPDTATNTAAPPVRLRDITIPSNPRPLVAPDHAPTAATGRGAAEAPAGLTSKSSPNGELHGLAFRQRAMAGMTSRDSALAAWNEDAHEVERWQTMSDATARSIEDSKRDAYKLAQRVGTAGSNEVHVPTGNGLGGVGAVAGGLGGSISLPLFSRGPSRAQRVRDSIIDADVRAGLARLAARAAAKRDSLRVVALRDSLRADSLHADPIGADSARRLAHARRP